MLNFTEASDPDRDFEPMLEATLDGDVVADVRAAQLDGGAWELTLHRPDLPADVLAEVVARAEAWAVADLDTYEPPGEHVVGLLLHTSNVTRWRMRLSHHGLDLAPAVHPLGLSSALLELLRAHLERPGERVHAWLERPEGRLAVEAIPLPDGALSMRLGDGCAIAGRASAWAASLRDAMAQLGNHSAQDSPGMAASCARHTESWESVCRRLSGAPAEPAAVANGIDAPLPSVASDQIQLVSRIAVSALSEVYQATVGGRLCALKVARVRYDPREVGACDTAALHLHTGSSRPWDVDPAQVLRRQFDFMWSLELPFVPRVHGLLELDLDGEPRTALMMDWVRGDRATSRGFSVRHRLQNIGRIARHLLVLQERCLVWEDLKPAHCICHDGEVMLIDPANGARGLGDASCDLITPAYRGPSFASAGHPSVATLSTMLLEALLGRYPFAHRDPDALPLEPTLASVAQALGHRRLNAFPLQSFPRCPAPQWEPAHRLALAGHQGVLRDGMIHAALDHQLPSLDSFAELTFAAFAEPPNWSSAMIAHDYLLERAPPPPLEGSEDVERLYGSLHEAVTTRKIPLRAYREAVEARAVRPAPHSYAAAVMNLARALGVPTPPSQRERDELAAARRVQQLDEIRSGRAEALERWHAEQRAHLSAIFGEDIHDDVTED